MEDYDFEVVNEYICFRVGKEIYDENYNIPEEDYDFWEEEVNVPSNYCADDNKAEFDDFVDVDCSVSKYDANFHSPDIHVQYAQAFHI